MEPVLSVFANFYIDSEERLQRMKDSHQSLRDVPGVSWLVNVRGARREDAADYLRQHGATVFWDNSPEGWFHDSRVLSARVSSRYVLLWMEDHLCLRPEKILPVVEEMRLQGLDVLTYSFWNQGQMRRRYAGVDLARGAEIDWFEHTAENNPAVQRHEGGSYLVSYASIMTTTLFRKILLEKREFRWPKETPFDFEIDPGDVQWLPLKRAVPKYELFASIDCDHSVAGSCLISRGLYPERAPRQSYAAGPGKSPGALRSLARRLIGRRDGQERA